MVIATIRRPLSAIIVTALVAASFGCARVEPFDVHVDVHAMLAGVRGEAADNSKDSWPGWRGGTLHGVSTSTGLPERWNRVDNVRWVREVPGQGNSSPVVWGDRVYLTTQLDEQPPQLAVVCFARQSGELLWTTRVGTPSGATHRKNGHASATVTTDGERVFAYFGSLGLYCLDTAGRQLWHASDCAVDHAWGAASSPLLFKDIVVQLADGQGGSHLSAYHIGTGHRLWSTSRRSDGSWTSPIIWQPEEGRPLVVVNGTGSSTGRLGEVVAYDLAVGSEVWRVSGTSDLPCPTMIASGGLLVSSSKRSLIGLSPQAGDRGRLEPLWRCSNDAPEVPTGVIYRDRLFLVTDGGVVSCLDPSTGERVWRQRLRGTFSASLVAADGKLFAASEQGTVYVLAAEDEFRLLATNRMNESCLATPAIAYGEIFIRTRQHLYCIARPDSSSTVTTVDASNGPTEKRASSTPSDVSG